MNKKYALLVGAFLLTVATTYAATTTFNDEASFAPWYKDAVKQMKTEGIVTGYADGSFKAENPVTRGELSLILQRYEDNIVKKHVKNLADEVKNELGEEVEDYVEEYRNDYFDSRIQGVIRNTLSYADKDIDYKTAIIMAASEIKKLPEAPDFNKLELKKLEAVNVPKGYEIYEDYSSGIMLPNYVHYKGEKAILDVIESVDEWYGPYYPS